MDEINDEEEFDFKDVAFENGNAVSVSTNGGCI